MLGLADRGRILDLLEKTMGGKIADALKDLAELYDRGADPLAVMQDLLELTHFLTRVKVAPGAEGFFDGGSGEAKRATEIAGKLSVPSLTRAWQMLLKGLFEVRDATRPVQAAEMALIRLAYAADLPPTEKLVRDLLDGEAPPAKGAPARAPQGAMSSSPRSVSQTARALPASAPAERPEGAPTLASLEDIVALAQANNASALKVQLENYVHLVHIEAGKIEFRPAERAPRTLAGDLAQKLKDWTGSRWVVTVAREGGAPTIAEQKRSAKAQRLESVMQEPMVRAVLDRFPGAEVVAVRDILAESDLPAAADEAEESE
jgi:DNA polymerase-3 subunit gamma/tau